MCEIPDSLIEVRSSFLHCAKLFLLIRTGESSPQHYYQTKTMRLLSYREPDCRHQLPSGEKLKKQRPRKLPSQALNYLDLSASLCST